jgi:GH25 family lysozyme M1 (1,4-beta-N-acetylmuramidase)
MPITGEGIDVAYPQHFQNLEALRTDITGGYAWVKIYDPDDERPVRLDQVAQLRAAGFKVGGYGFFRDSAAGAPNVAKQANGFLAALARTDANDIMPMIDLEPTGIGRWGFTNTVTGAARASAVGRYVHQALEWNGYRPVTYSFESFIDAMNVGTWGFPVRKLIANYSSTPKGVHIGHQYSSTARHSSVINKYGQLQNFDLDRVSIDISAREGKTMAWRVANSLNKLLKQLNDRAPNRNKASDGSIGDTAHSNRTSDHNPWYGPGIVTARDFTHDPSGGLDCNWLAEQLRTVRDPRIKYVIWNHKIFDSRYGWSWAPYYGANPHTKHLHLSVVANSLNDNTADWNLGGGGSTPPAAPQIPIMMEEYDMQYLANDGGWNSQGLGVPTGSSELVFHLGFDNARLHHVKFFGADGEEMQAGRQTDKDVMGGRPLGVNVPVGAISAEVSYSIYGTVHHMGSSFRSDL